ncbi:MAG TPA: sigma 54-interacting transcriptional regulator [Myxococcota bacterium]|nr:sigma 54-interacting transcriptional regulator [Myxococcota bacterium]
MERFASLLLDVWREVGRHIEIEEAAQRCAPLLSRRLPVDRLLMRRLDLAGSAIETVASASAAEEAEHGAAAHLRSPLEPVELQELVLFCRRGRPLRGPAASLARRVPGLLPEGIDGELLVAPLLRGEEPAGAFALMARAPRQFEREHEEVARALAEPFAVALENDRRIAELQSLRQAAEADRETLLTRLGREDLAETIVGAETGLRASMERIELVAPSDVPVLLLGETGSGKEVAARAVHARSRRAGGPFLRVNCGAIPAGLIDSELFGHERGSFTGASAQRKGWFERADGGTLFLDEIGELPLAAQVRLLRILQDGSFERVGGTRTLHADVRVVAATHRDLHAMVSEGRFREDLWYRLAVFVIHLPPLRERPEDISALAAHFALRAAKRFGLPALLPTRDDVSLLAGYAWPGNIRELGAVLDRAVLIGQGRALAVAQALGSSPGAAGASATALPSITAAPSDAATAADALDSAMVRHIEGALARTFGRIEGPFGAARLLQINPHTLRARMRKLGIDWRRFRGSDSSA